MSEDTLRPKPGLYWASVGGGNGEPVRIVKEPDGLMMFSLGCGDPHPLDGVVLIERIEKANIPMTEAQRERALVNRQRRQRREAKLGIHRGYRTFP